MSLRNPQVRMHFDDELIVDLFAGGGGASTGLEEALGISPDIACNHDPEAVALHMVNHPNTKHFCEDVNDLDIVAACAGRPVGLLWLSPDCTYHSKARGGKPFRDRNKARRRRGLANVAIKWAKTLPRPQQPRIICLENVEEFEDWGPLNADGDPDPLKRGLSFRRFIKSLENLGYQVEWRELRGCDYGAPTIRKRLFLVARNDGEPIVWPEPTHGDPDKAGFKASGLKVWRTAAECIDWSIPCPSIFERKKPLVENTLKRIAAGLRRYVIEAAKPFIVQYHAPKRDGDHRNKSVYEPLPTQTTENRFGLVEASLAPFLTEHANASKQRTFDIDEPLRTQCAEVKGGHFSVVAPTLIQTGYGERKGQAPRAPGLGKPLGTVVAGGAKHALVTAFLNKHYTGVVGSDLVDPLGTITTQDHHSLTTSNLIKLKGTSKQGKSVEKPLDTIMAGGTHHAEVRAFLMKYYREGGQWQACNDPMHTVTTKARLGLVVITDSKGKKHEYCIVDIGLRMLKAKELYRAQGFPANYIIDIIYKGKLLSQEAQIRMCGNSVCPQLAAAIARANFQFQRMRMAA